MLYIIRKKVKKNDKIIRKTVLTMFRNYCNITLSIRFAVLETKKGEVQMKVTLRAARVNVNLSREEAAKRANVSESTLYKWEKGECDPPISKLLVLCNLYKCTVDDLTWN